MAAIALSGRLTGGGEFNDTCLSPLLSIVVRAGLCDASVFVVLCLTPDPSPLRGEGCLQSTINGTPLVMPRIRFRAAPPVHEMERGGETRIGEGETRAGERFTGPQDRDHTPLEVKKRQGIDIGG